MFGSGWSVMILLFHLFGSVNTSPVPSYTTAPPLPLQISSPTPSPTILPPLHSSSLMSKAPSPHFTSYSEEPAKSGPCSLIVSPSRVVVRFEDPFTVNCSVTTEATLGWEVSLARPEPFTGYSLVWSVDKMTNWSIKATCFTLADEGGQCQRNPSLVVYKPPDNVSLSLVNHTGPILEGHQYTLECAVKGIAPVEYLTVTFYRGQKTLGQQWSNKTTKEPVTEIFSLDISPSKDDDTLQYWCEAKLELGPEGPRHPPVMRSQNINASFHFGPELACPTKLQVREGERLRCEVRGNPKPAITWFRDGKEVVLPTNLSRQDTGIYTVWAKGPLEQRNFTVEVEVLTGSGAASNWNRHFQLAVLLVQLILWL